MGKYIPLEPLLAEIERRKEKCDTFYDIALSNNAELAKIAIEEQKKQYDSLSSFVNTLVKELDLEKEIDRVWDNTSDNFSEDGWKEFEDIAKHFFELGLEASNPLTWEDIEMIGKLRLKVALDLRNKELESSIDNPIKFTEEDFCKEVLKRFKAQKGE